MLRSTCPLPASSRCRCTRSGRSASPPLSWRGGCGTGSGSSGFAVEIDTSQSIGVGNIHHRCTFACVTPLWRRSKMRKQLLLSTGIICLMLAPAVSFGQAPGGRGEEQKQMRPSEAGKGAASQERGAERAQERAQGVEQKTHGATGREEKGAGSRQT